MTNENHYRYNSPFVYSEYLFKSFLTNIKLFKDVENPLMDKIVII
jgi:hypothetical protein